MRFQPIQEGIITNQALFRIKRIYKFHFFICINKIYNQKKLLPKSPRREYASPDVVDWEVIWILAEIIAADIHALRYRNKKYIIFSRNSSLNHFPQHTSNMPCITDRPYQTIEGIISII